MNQQLRLFQENTILYLHEYEHLPDEIFRWKSDDDLQPSKLWEASEAVHYSDTGKQKLLPRHLCVGIGTYRTLRDGEWYLCAILDADTRQVVSYSMGAWRSVELVKRALEILFRLCKYEDVQPILLSSRNPIYRKAEYQEVLSAFPIRSRMTQPGTHGQAMVVSAFFSQLMRRKGSLEFKDWQEAVDWLTNDIFNYNWKIKYTDDLERSVNPSC